MKPILCRTLSVLVACTLACAGGSPDAADVHDDVPPRPDTAQPLDTAGDAGGPDAVEEGAAEWTAADTAIPSGAGVGVLSAVRTARHAGHDRVVFEFEGDAPGFRVSYSDRPVRQCGSGDEVPVAGDAWLSVVFEPAVAHTEEGRPTIEERARRLDLPTIIELKLICDFEGQVEWVAGVRSATEHRVLTLREPARVVLDVRHPAGSDNEERL